MGVIDAAGDVEVARVSEGAGSGVEAASAAQ